MNKQLTKEKTGDKSCIGCMFLIVGIDGNIFCKRLFDKEKDCDGFIYKLCSNDKCKRKRN